jgi:hypothetical protein
VAGGDGFEYLPFLFASVGWIISVSDIDMSLCAHVFMGLVCMGLVGWSSEKPVSVLGSRSSNRYTCPKNKQVELD